MKKAKRFFAFAVILCIILSSVSCKSVKNDYESYFSVYEETDGTQIRTPSSEDKDTASKKAEESTTNGNGFSNTDNSSASDKPTVQNSFDVQIEKTISTDEIIEEPAISSLIDAGGVLSSHISLSEKNYYQYNTLDSKGKNIYQNIVTAICESRSIVDISKLSVRENEALTVFSKVLSDYPQYFYVSRYCMLAYGLHKKTVRAIILLYTDGVTTDEYDNGMHLTKEADRNAINEKINELQEKVNSVIGKISSDAEDVIKEKIIHDYIAKTVSYDYDTAKSINNIGITVPNAFDVYGAAVDGLAVCEGYSKLFQYLCYSVGINSTQVIGTSNGGNHMWNAVLIDEEWYQIDVTWNDTEPMVSYSYFNLSDEKLSKDHTIDDSEISVPQCVSSENSFISVFAVCITNLTQAPTNYETAIANIKKAGDKPLYVYIEGCELDRLGMINTQKYAKYIQQYILRKTSDFYAYLSARGMSLSNGINRSNEFIVLTLKY